MLNKVKNNLVRVLLGPLLLLYGQLLLVLLFTATPLMSDTADQYNAVRSANFSQKMNFSRVLNSCSSFGKKVRLELLLH
jgi:hypothetical protein